jgi:RNA polymerase sigma-70 factor, ECF subfamily
VGAALARVVGHLDTLRRRRIVSGERLPALTPRPLFHPPTLGGAMPDVPELSTVPATASVADVGTLTPGGFQTLLVAVLSPAFGYALRLTRNRADAEDLVQDASLLAFRARDSFQPGTNFKAWYFQILTRCFWARHRTQRRRPVTVDLEDTPDLFLYSRSAAAGLPWEGDDPASQLIERLGTERVSSAIGQLPEEYGVVCTLYFLEDFAYHEIADVLGIPVGTVRSRLHRGRKMLQKVLWRLAEESGIVRDLAREQARGEADVRAQTRGEDGP